VAKVVKTMAPAPEDEFFEIGPGRGALTRELTARVRRVVAFEIDRDLAADLQATAPANLTVVTGDFLQSSWVEENHPIQPVRVVGNLPYNVASPILFKLIDLFNAGTPFSDATVMLQREVADRITAAPGSKEYGTLGILVQLSAQVDRLLALPAGAFRPVPKVQSALLRLRFHPPAPAPQNLQTCRTLVQSLFTRRRKTLDNALRAFPSLTDADRPTVTGLLRQAGIDGQRRPETLDLAEVVRLADTVESLRIRS
jgi:16S rRNA (adenine1518-N6/adenine1519-N6)-dimethyltransferase